MISDASALAISVLRDMPPRWRRTRREPQTQSPTKRAEWRQENGDSEATTGNSGRAGL